MIDGILCVDKPKGITSRDVVNIVCKKLNTKKVGHTGTLDPLATGVLILGVNEGTKLIEILTSDNKEYEALVRLGYETDTLDIEGTIVNESFCKNITNELIDNCLQKFNCEYEQEVPKYSAVKVNGKKLYEYARNNISITLPRRLVKIYSLKRTSDVIYNQNVVEFRISCCVSKGTYIRSLIRDIGRELGTYATMAELRRTRQGNILLSDCFSINDIEHDSYKLKSMNECIDNFDKIVPSEDLLKKIINGSIIDNIYNNETVAFVTKQGNLLAIYKIYDKDISKMKPWKMFRA